MINGAQEQIKFCGKPTLNPIRTDSIPKVFHRLLLYQRNVNKRFSLKFSVGNENFYEMMNSGEKP